MKRFAVLFVLLALLAVPVAVSAQYGNDYPMGGNSGGGGNGGGGNSGGGITIGGGSSGGNMGGSMGGDQAGAKDVDIVDFSFQPSMVFVHPGDTVDWYNQGGANHTVTSDSGAFDSGVLSPGGEYSETFDTPGTYKYHCEIHENMHGTILVLGS
jgi:plastocyanin